MRHPDAYHSGELVRGDGQAKQPEWVSEGLGLPEEYAIGDPLEGLDEVQQDLSVLGAFRCRQLGPCRLFPSCHRRSAAGSNVEVVSLRLPFPLLGNVPSRSHPNSGEVRQEAYRSVAAVGFGQQDDDDQPDVTWPRARSLALEHEGHPLRQDVVGEPESCSGVHPVPSQASACREGEQCLPKDLHGHRRQWFGFVRPLELVVFGHFRPLLGPVVFLRVC